MAEALMVGLGGFIGAVARYGLCAVVGRATGNGFPYGTLAVNVFGCLAIGALLAAGDGRAALHPSLRLFLAVGALGAFTTFSAFGNETLALLRGGGLTAALLNVTCNVVLGLGAVWLGHALVKTVSAG